MAKKYEYIFLGIFILILSLIMYKSTHNIYGWLILYMPGSSFTLYGLYLIFRDL
jgi:hypothetical protein